MYVLFGIGSLLAAAGLLWRIATGRSGLDELTGAAELVMIAFIAITGALFFFYRRIRRRVRRFEDWLEHHAVALRDGETVETLRGRPVDRNTTVRTFEALVGLGFGPWRVPTARYFDGESAAREAWVYAFTTFLFGWWSLPFGPLRTLRALYHAARGGRRQRLHDLLPPPS